ncbi:YfhO family protein [Armatimonas sp.]|uniref:YfhO family protein n=1 Tax=Armatimonas sp. TaxID=1872638 RepID=UPI003753B570
MSRPIPLALLGGGGLALGTLFLFAEVVFRGRVLFYGDLSLYFLPQLDFQRSELLAGRIPLWNPYINCGQPFVGNPQTWPLYPSSLLLLIFEAARANAISTLLHVLWAGLGMLVFLRQQKLTPVAATLGAVAFAFGGAFVSKVQFPNMLQAMSWLPWLLWATGRVIMRPLPGRVALLGLCVGLTLLAAHAQVTLMQLYLVLAWVLFRLMTLPRAERLRPLSALALAALLGLALALAQLLPVVEHALASTRPQLSLGAANRFYLPWRELILLIAPNALGNPALPGGWHGKANFWEPCCYIGLVPLVLVFFVQGNKLPRQRAVITFWLWGALLSFWLALGRYGGLYVLAFYALPGVKQFHDPARWLYLGTFALSILSAYGLDQLRLREVGKWALVLGAMGELIFFSRTLNPTCPPEALRVVSASTIAPVGRVFASQPYAQWKFLAPYKDYQGLPSQALMTLTTPNLPLLRRWRQASGYEPVARRDVSETLKALGALPTNPAALSVEQVQQLEALGVGLVEGSDGTRVLASPAPLVSGGTVESEVPGRFEIVPMGTEVVLREVHAAGWRAWANGKALEIQTAPPIFMKVQVPAGTKRVLFRYDPLFWRVGLFLSLTAGCILFGLMLSALRGKPWRS